ncbi:aldo/keto reductase [Pilimelia columellifera]|uniref:NADP-dependent oxidoreductase domain-containing protein n=1 Tax=Pilimelia columellifera subsp. columellifera TaxID=706583 RepID=A0ABP6A9N4_9ACTN
MPHAPAALPTRLPERWRGGYRQSVLLLGAAQLGGAYGAPPVDGADPTTVELLRTAASVGVTHIDTARAYGLSERRVGTALRALASDQLEAATRLDVVTKIAPLAEVLAGERFVGLAPDLAAAAAVEASVGRSMGELGRERGLTLLLHRAADAAYAHGAAWQRLRRYLADGQAHRIGVSVQDPSELRLALELPELGYLQLPCNILDGRWLDPGLTTALLARPDLVVTARSVFLQGLLAAGRSVRWPKLDDGDRDSLISTLDKMSDELGRAGRDDLCLAYVLSLPWVTSLVVGAETAGQLRAHVLLARRDPLTTSEREWVRSGIPELPAQLLDPRRWRD